MRCSWSILLSQLAGAFYSVPSQLVGNVADGPSHGMGSWAHDVSLDLAPLERV